MWFRLLKSRKRVYFPACLAACFAVAVIDSTEVRAEFLLSAGDVVEVSIAGAAELRTRAAIDLEGKLTLPIVGGIMAAGLSIEALRQRIQGEFAERAVSLRAPDGRTVITPISPEEISVSIAEYRPVYLAGDLTRVGEVPYRPGMTVRQAIAVAGGYDVIRFRINNPYLEAINFNAERAALLSELAVEGAKKKYLQSQLEKKPLASVNDVHPGAGALPSLETPTSVVSEYFRAMNDDYEKDLVHLRETSARMAVRASFLETQKAREEEGSQADVEEFERAKALLERGTTSTQRVTDARRAMLLSATRALQTGVEAAQARVNQEETNRSLQKLNDQRRIRLLTELQDANTRIVRLEANLAAANQKLNLVGTMQSAWGHGKAAKPEIMIYRNENGTKRSFSGSEDAGLVPGDVVEVRLVNND